MKQHEFLMKYLKCFGKSAPCLSAWKRSHRLSAFDTVEWEIVFKSTCVALRLVVYSKINICFPAFSLFNATWGLSNVQQEFSNISLSEPFWLQIFILNPPEINVLNTFACLQVFDLDYLLNVFHIYISQRFIYFIYLDFYDLLLAVTFKWINY